MKVILSAACSIALCGCVTIKETVSLPSRTDFIFAQAYHIDVDPNTGMTRAHCNKIRKYRASASHKDMATVEYEEFSEQGWKKMKADLRKEGDQWIWVAGDPPKCSITIFEG